MNHHRCSRLCSVLALLCLFISTLQAQAAGRVEYWVSPEGDDANSGSANEPFATLERARDAVREAGRYWGDAHINLYGGVYRLTEPFVLEPQDSGRGFRNVVYRAAPGEEPIICGSIPVTGWELHDADLGIYSAEVGEVESRQFYINGVRAQRARTEDYPASFVPVFHPDFIPDPDAPCLSDERHAPATGVGGIDYIVDSLNPEGWRDPMTWTNQDDIEAVIVTQWKSMRCMVEEVTDDPGFSAGSSLILMQEPGWQNAHIFRNGPTNIDFLGMEIKDIFPKTVGEPGIWSFWEVTYFENAYQFLDEPGEWYLDEGAGVIYYIPREGEDIMTAEAELPIVEKLIDAQGSPEAPIKNLRFENLNFAYATWLAPNDPSGYVCDQSGFHVVGEGHRTNFGGHVEFPTRMPGNVSFRYAQNIRFEGNRFEHMGAVALDFGTGSQRNRVLANTFFDTSGGAVQLGGVQKYDARPETPSQLTSRNWIMDNKITYAAQEYFGSAAIYFGFTERTIVSHNYINHTSWAGIAAGWGWGLLDPGSYPGIAGACSGQWGEFTTLTANRRNWIANNWIENFVEVLWDSGAVYTLGRQGRGLFGGMLISGNVAIDKRPDAGSNVFYTDGGSRYIRIWRNVSINNPVGYIDFGRCALGDEVPPEGVLLPNEMQEVMCLVTDLKIHYGGEFGGCRTYGDIQYFGNFFDSYDFYDPCPFTYEGVKHPTDMRFIANRDIDASSESLILDRIFQRAGPRW